ncbi:hypothetical protein JW960_17400 [candidate division KSB1 bacterium]|nr:hypothetical protein [candidate division KSB1 bacterium]
MTRRFHSLQRQHAKSISHKMFIKLNRLINNWEEARNTDSAMFFKRPGKVLWANMLIGMSRGVGFVIGVSIVGALVVTILGWVLGKFVSIPIIGEYIAMIVAHVQQYLNSGNNF